MKPTAFDSLPVGFEPSCSCGPERSAAHRRAYNLAAAWGLNPRCHHGLPVLRGRDGQAIHISVSRQDDALEISGDIGWRGDPMPPEYDPPKGFAIRWAGRKPKDAGGLVHPADITHRWLLVRASAGQE
jgi:hypothetical protein